jgi:predicted DNA-binding antitoxin AbrB/MazE fold protein
MTPNVITTEAIYENGVLRPVQPLPLEPQQRVNLVIHPAGAQKTWPDNVAEIYQEINNEEKRLANSIWPVVQETWPIDGD